MTVDEQALLLDCHGARLAAVLARPAAPAAATPLGVVIVVGGPQYRAGSHRQFVLLSRHLAAAGHAVLRFDCRGMGDSEGEFAGFEHVEEDIGCAVDALFDAQPGLQGVALWGLCDGASAALLYLHQRPDARVQGLCLVNPWVRSEASLARTHVKHYYAKRLTERAFWARLLTGRVAAGALPGLWRNLRQAFSPRPAIGANNPSNAPYQQRMAQAWQAFGGPILLLLSEHDYTAREFEMALANDPAWHGALGQAGVERQVVADADHTFSDGAARRSAERSTGEWLARQRRTHATTTPEIV